MRNFDVMQDAVQRRGAHTPFPLSHWERGFCFALRTQGVALGYN